MSGFANAWKMKKNAALLLLIFTLLFTITACTQPAAQPKATATPTQSAENVQLELTLEELAAYNGKDGKPAYVAVDGVIYDVTNSARWRNGEHNGFSAGQDLTEIIKGQSPHGTSTLSRMPVVGKIKK